MTVTMTDLFCGVGGSSTGAMSVPGIRLVMSAGVKARPPVSGGRRGTCPLTCGDAGQRPERSALRRRPPRVERSPRRKEGRVEGPSMATFLPWRNGDGRTGR